MILALTAIVFAAQLATRPPESGGGDQFRHEIQYRRYGHPPPCGNGFDLDARDGMCYPNGMVPPQFQSARQYRGPGPGPRYGRYPVPCGNGADVDVRDGLCYPNGTVPPQFQQGRQYRQYRRPPPQYYEDDDDYDDRPRRRY